MRLLRFICLLFAIAAVYFAQYIFDQGTLVEFFPAWLLVRFSFASRLIRWQPEDLNMLAWGSSALAAILFGLIAPAWPSVQGLTYVKPVLQKGGRATSFLALVAMVLALLLTTFVFANIALPLGEFGIQASWLLSCLFVLFTGLLLNRERTLQVRSVSSSSPERSWLMIILLLVGAGLLFSFNLLELPPTIETQIARYGLQAQSMLQRPSMPDLLVAGETGQPLLTTLVTAITIRLSGDTLLGMRLAGVLAGLLTVVATWLVGCELFRRSARRGRQDELIEDDGRYPALLGAAIVAGSVVAIHFSRLPVLLEPVVWGMLGLWAMLRGMRRADSFGLALSGVLAGYATLIHPSGMALLLTMFFLLLLSTFIPGTGFPRAIAASRHWGWAIWLLGVICVLSPALRMWLANPQTFWLDFPGLGNGFLRNTIANLLGLQLQSDRSLLFGYTGHFLHSVLAPLLLLAIGGLLLNIDRLPGWVLTIWFVVVAGVGAALTSQSSSWSELLPILPAVGLAVAFAIDRVRSTLLDTIGIWLNQSAIYWGLGLVLWATLANWIDYVHFIDTQRDSASEMAIAVHRLDAAGLDSDAKFVIVDTEDGQTPGWDHPVLKLIGAEENSTERFQSIPFTELTSELPVGSTLLIVPQGRDALARTQELFPDEIVTTERDRRGNPVLYSIQIH